MGGYNNKFFKHYTVMVNLNLSEYCDLEYSETDAECSSSDFKTESEDEDSRLMIFLDRLMVLRILFCIF